jgi:hypothetical protein
MKAQGSHVIESPEPSCEAHHFWCFQDVLRSRAGRRLRSRSSHLTIAGVSSHPCNLEAAHAREHDVEHHDVVPAGERALEAFDAVARRLDLVPFAAQRALDELA